MKVILLKDVASVGQRGAVKEVSSGYALNFLLPNGLAEQATPEKMKAHEAVQKRDVEMHEKEAALLGEAIQSLEGKRVEITARATEKGGLFKAIGVADIVRTLGEKMGKHIPPEAVKLEKPIKEVGEHAVVLTIGDARARITIAVQTA